MPTRAPNRDCGQALLPSGQDHFSFGYQPGSLQSPQCWHNGPINGVAFVAGMEDMPGLGGVGSLSPTLIPLFAVLAWTECEIEASLPAPFLKEIR